MNPGTVQVKVIAIVQPVSNSINNLQNLASSNNINVITLKLD